MAAQHAAGPRIRVRTLGGAYCEILPRRGRTADSIKREIEKKLRVPAAQQRLIHGRRVLRDNDLHAAALSRLLAAPAGMDAPLELTLLVRSPTTVKLLKDMERDIGAFITAPVELRGDKEVVLKAVRQDGQALQHATEELRGNKEIVIEAVRQNGQAMQYAAKELQCDKRVVMEMVREDIEALRHASEELRGDREVVLEAVERDGWALQHATKELRGDKEFVLQAVGRNGWAAWECATQELRGDRDVILQAAGRDGFSLPHVRIARPPVRQIMLEAIR